MWDKLANVNEMVLANYLKNEYPQTVAVVLSKIKPEHAAKVLGVLPEPFAMEVVMRMLRMVAVQKAVLDDVERTLRNERSEEHTSELQSLMSISHPVFCLNKKHITRPIFSH